MSRKIIYIECKTHPNYFIVWHSAGFPSPPEPPKSAIVIFDYLERRPLLGERALWSLHSSCPGSNSNRKKQEKKKDIKKKRGEKRKEERLAASSSKMKKGNGRKNSGFRESMGCSSQHTNTQPAGNLTP